MNTKKLINITLDVLNLIGAAIVMGAGLSFHVIPLIVVGAFLGISNIILGWWWSYD